jgi:hypothetical protein
MLFGEGNTYEEACQLLDRSIDAGVNFFDSAGVTDIVNAAWRFFANGNRKCVQVPFPPHTQNSTHMRQNTHTHTHKYTHFCLYN